MRHYRLGSNFTISLGFSQKWGIPVLKRIALALIAAAAVFQLATAPVAAQARPVYEKPVYNPATKSYFELVDGRSFHGQGPNWEEALRLAQQRNLNGVPGRLAIVRSPETDMFIRLNLRPNQHTWFGLRFDCARKALIWSDGTELKPGEYTNWNPNGWYSSPQWGFCVGDHLMPAFWPFHSGVRHWMMQRSPKRFYSYVVEYPTGGEVSQVDARRGLAVPVAASKDPAPPAKADDAPDSAPVATD